MISETFSFGRCPGTAVLWLPDCAPVGVVQVTHGMTEHMGRWDTLAAALADQGMVVAGFDLRGHGSDVVQPGIAGFGQEDWQASLEDIRALYLALQQRFPGLPHHMLGFSLGSFLVREYLGQYPGGLASAILLGTGQQPGAILGILQALVKTQIRKAGWTGTTPLVKKLSFETYNRKFAPNRTSADWLCADAHQLDAYLQDPRSREEISAGLFYHLLGSMKRCAAPDSCANWDKSLPVLLLSGAEDPVGDMGKGVRSFQTHLVKSGLQKVQLHLIPNARHDLLHEEASGAAEKARQLLCRWTAGGAYEKAIQL